MALLRTARLFMHYQPALRVNDPVPNPLGVVLFTCPVGARAVLRSVQFFLEGNSGGASLNMFSDAVPAGVVIFEKRWNEVIEMEHSVTWNGQVVLNAGDRLEYTGSNGVTMVGSGAIMPIE